MTDIQEFDQQLQSEIQKFEEMINQLATKDYRQKPQFISKINNVQKSINTLIESYDMEINNLNKEQAQQYQSELQIIQNKYQTLKNRFNIEKNKQSGDNSKNDVVQNINIDISQLNKEQGIEYGSQLQQKGIGKLDNALLRIEQTKELGNEINTELDRQIQALDRMHNKVKDTMTVLKRTQIHLNYFAKEVVKDKFIMCCIILILIAVLLIIVFSSIQKKAKQSQ